MAKVLIVDDSDAHLHSLSKIVESDGHLAITASHGDEGLEKAKAESPDLILLDIVMPDMNGFQVSRKLRRDDATKNIPIIFVTTKNQETDKIWGMRQGAKAYITKPVDKSELISAMNDALSS